jgi:hypothetical protein
VQTLAATAEVTFIATSTDHSGCVCTVPLAGKGPEPWTFTTFRALVGLLNFFVWLLLLAVVGVLMAMLVWYGVSGESLWQFLVHLMHLSMPYYVVLTAFKHSSADSWTVNKVLAL